MTKNETISERVFCVGMNKTGTSTIKHCFEALRFTPIASPKTYSTADKLKIKLFYSHKNYAPILELAEQYKSFEDRPWNMWAMYRHLDEHFPDAKFILTERDPESWWRSTERWVTVTKPEVLERYQLHLRVDQPNQETMTESYLRYNEEVKAYFKGTGKLLVMNLEAGDGWEKICPFLEVPVPEREFPHANKQKYTAEDVDKVRAERRLKHGIECQSCGHRTMLRKDKSEAAIAVKRLRNAQDKPFYRKLTPGYLRWQLRAIGPEKFEDWPQARGVFHKLHRLYTGVRRLTPRGSSASRVGSAQPLPEKEFAAVACFFNPGGSRNRVKNFKRFLAGLQPSGVRCLVVELAFGNNDFVITDYDDVIQIRTDDVLWHKERLLNIGIQQLLSEGYQKIAWLDGDITFAKPDWPREISRRLDESNLVQVFETIGIATHDQGPPMVAPCAIRYHKETGELYQQPAHRGMQMLKGILKGGQSGFGWAARAEVFQQVQLFEHAVVGGGDKLMYIASLVDDYTTNSFKALTHSKFPCAKCGHKNLSVPYTAAYEDWARRWASAVDGKVDYARLHITDMFHGKRSDRGYMARHDILYRNGYNPAEDLVEEGPGCFTWAPGRDDLGREIEAYFLSRREDV
jgi:DNA-directed RNA polymerase subunit RPC12/RpoP